ncbi:TIGR04255 family protein [Corynebacterium xerosis]|uniref:TIGR04255 family protein n=1 Tax=Corynebacterium xerosis TaxID=1725 RepID=A0ABV3URE4_9CORY
MSDQEKFRPFTGGREPKFRLKEATLPLVLGQLKWPARQRVDREFDKLAEEFGTAIEPQFPNYETRNESRLIVSRDGVEKEAGNDKAYHWRCSSGIWNVVLSRRYLSLFCLSNDNYSYGEFKKRLNLLIVQLSEKLGIDAFEGAAFRSVNIFPTERYGYDLDNMFDSSLLGLSPLLPNAQVKLAALQNRAIYRIGEVQFNVQASRFDKGVHVDPLMPKVPADSWIIDLDSSVSLDVGAQIDELIGKMADINYDFFVAALTEKGRERLGVNNAG